MTTLDEKRRWICDNISQLNNNSVRESFTLLRDLVGDDSKFKVNGTGTCINLDLIAGNIILELYEFMKVLYESDVQTVQTNPNIALTQYADHETEK